jgi:hypothetical protein
MTAAEYLEMVQEQVGFFENLEPDRTLRCTEQQCTQLHQAHLRYCEEVRAILGVQEPEDDDD